MNRARRKRQNRKWARGLALTVQAVDQVVFDTTPTVDLATVLNSMTVAKLVEYGRAEGIKVASRWTKPVLIAAIVGAQSAKEATV
jgi:hypothetical protein